MGMCGVPLFYLISLDTRLHGCAFSPESWTLWNGGDILRSQGMLEPSGEVIYAFQNKVVWITGASSGYGVALALAFHEAGAKIIVSARSEHRLREVAGAGKMSKSCR